MGVADGVGGWSQTQMKGANPALYSRKIMHYACEQLEAFDDIVNDDYDIDDYYGVDPTRILSRAYDLTCRDAAVEGLVGSTTAMIVILRDDELRIANIGDCGLMIIRNNETIFRSEEQQHSFNFPFQLGTGSKDLPGNAQRYAVKVLEGDIVIMGSDGIFDNVFDEEVLEIVRGVVKSGNPAYINPQIITDALLLRARDVAEDPKTVSSPFQSRAIQEGLYYQGGKLDDVTIVAGVIRLAEDSPDRR
ncbi:phosphatase 2C-like domain-containing protein [Chytridium lagenaria]|nr:phosphatase 2C-like domain-containing protein [Chytridium lagenaria]